MSKRAHILGVGGKPTPAKHALPTWQGEPYDWRSRREDLPMAWVDQAVAWSRALADRFQVHQGDPALVYPHAESMRVKLTKLGFPQEALEPEIREILRVAHAWSIARHRARTKGETPKSETPKAIVSDLVRVVWCRVCGASCEDSTHTRLHYSVTVPRLARQPDGHKGLTHGVACRVPRAQQETRTMRRSPEYGDHTVTIAHYGLPRKGMPAGQPDASVRRIASENRGKPVGEKTPTWHSSKPGPGSVETRATGRTTLRVGHTGVTPRAERRGQVSMGSPSPAPCVRVSVGDEYPTVYGPYTAEGLPPVMTHRVMIDPDNEPHGLTRPIRRLGRASGLSREALRASRKIKTPGIVCLVCRPGMVRKLRKTLSRPYGPLDRRSIDDILFGDLPHGTIPEGCDFPVGSGIDDAPRQVRSSVHAPSARGETLDQVISRLTGRLPDFR